MFILEVGNPALATPTGLAWNHEKTIFLSTISVVFYMYTINWICIYRDQACLGEIFRWPPLPMLTLYLVHNDNVCVPALEIVSLLSSAAYYPGGILASCLEHSSCVIICIHAFVLCAPMFILCVKRAKAGWCIVYIFWMCMLRRMSAVFSDVWAMQRETS